MSNVKSLEPQWLIGPFEVHRVVIEGRLIPNMTATKNATKTMLRIDDRFSLSVPNEMAYQVAHFAATAMAIGAGYTHIGGTSRDQPFAKQCAPA